MKSIQRPRSAPLFFGHPVLAYVALVAASALPACGASKGNGGSGTGGQSAGGSPSSTGSAGAPSSAAGASAGGVPGAGGNNAPGTGGASTGGSVAGDSGGNAGTASGGASTAGGTGMAGSGPAGGASACSDLGGGPVSTTTTHLDIPVHDPSVIWSGTRYYLFATGGSLNVRSSTNLQTWNNAGKVLSAVPAWVSTALGTNITGLWAPDISYFNCEFHAYYAGSTFGSNSSVIGLATTPSLETPTWTDQGLVVQSVTSNNYNAIDPNVSFDAAGAPWLSFGSFWSGIKMLQLDPVTGKPSTTNTTMYSLASRNGGAIEAPSIISHNGFYYLFVSFDKCCDGVNSTYKTMVGRASAITGPYTNKAGVSMMMNVAETLLTTSGRYIGPGGGTAFRNGTTYLYAFHYYDGMANGASKLQIRPINFDATDWPTLGDPLFP